MVPIANIVANKEQVEINAIELSFNTYPSYWRQGYTFEALKGIFGFLFKQGYDNILCSYDTGNVKSKNIGEKLGFLPYLIMRNTLEKNEVSIDTYVTILSKERYQKLYGIRSK